MVNEASVRVEVVFPSAARTVQSVPLKLGHGCTVGDALVASSLLSALTPQVVAGLDVGIWGQKVEVSHLLRDGDRVELYRPLTVDPKVARRERFKKQGAKKAAGLFARRRAGAKPGY